MEKRNVYMEKLEGNLSEFIAKLDKMYADYHSQVEKLNDFLIRYGQPKEYSGQAWGDYKPN